MAINNQKEVHFNEYCYTCKYRDYKTDVYPCLECLEIGSRVNSHRPEYYKRADNADLRGFKKSDCILRKKR